MISFWLLAGASAFSPAQGEDELAQLRYWQARPADEVETVEQLLYLQMRVGRWKEARRLLEKRKASEPSSAWTEMFEGDLCFWEGSPQAALGHYRRASSFSMEGKDGEQLEAKIADTEREIAYQKLVRTRSDWAKAGGVGTILVLLLLPFLLPLFWPHRSP